MNTIEYLRLDGKEEGRTEKEIIFVKNLLVSTDFSDEKIAGLADVSVEFVQEVREGKISN